MERKHPRPQDLTAYYEGNQLKKPNPYRQKHQHKPPADNLTAYYEVAYINNPEGYELHPHEQRSLFGVYLFGIITALVILSGAIAVVILSPHQQHGNIAERVITVTSPANLTPVSSVHEAVPAVPTIGVHKIPPKPIASRHLNKPTSRISASNPAPITTPSSNTCPANVNAKNKYEQTLLHVAAITSDVSKVRMLLNCGANVNAKTGYGYTPLFWAAREGSVDVARLLLDHGANVNAKTSTGDTPLRWAADSGKVDVARLLLDRGADVNAETGYGRTPLYWANRYGHTEVAALLRSRGGHS